MAKALTNDRDFQVLSAQTVQELHKKFINGIDAKARAAVPENTPKRDRLIEALKVFLIEAARKEHKVEQNELAAMAEKGCAHIKMQTKVMRAATHARLPKNSAYPSPDFSKKQLTEWRRAARKRRDVTAVKALFGKKDRLYLPLGDNTKAAPSATQQKIAAFLEKQGYKITDYNQGYATDVAGKQKFRIGKLLKNTPDLYNAFADDDSRALDHLMVVLSRNADDIARMSTGRAWSSCMGSGGMFYHYVPKDVRGGSIVAYLISEKDPDILNPLARILIKPFDKKEKRKGFLRGIFNRFAHNKVRVFMPDKRYGIHNDAFSQLVKAFVEEKLNKNIYGDFRLARELYCDGLDRDVSRKHGARLMAADGSLEWWHYGLRHRENGPAVERENGSKEWWRNGMRHREDGPAVERPQYDIHEWWIHGKQYPKDEFDKIQGRKNPSPRGFIIRL